MDSEPRTIWDTQANQSENNPLRAVISHNDVNNYYVDRTQKSMLSQLIKLKKDFKVLDVGCGVGRMSLWIAPQVEKIIGVDVSPKMIEIAGTRAISSELSNCEFLVLGEISLPFSVEEFDLVLAVWLLKYIVDEDKLKLMIREMCRLTKAGGSIVIIEEIDCNGPTLLQRGHFDGVSSLRRADYYVSLFQHSGMKIIVRQATHKASFLNKYSIISKMLGITKLQKLHRFMLSIVIGVDVLFDRLTKRQIPPKGHQLFHFEKIVS